MGYVLILSVIFILFLFSYVVPKFMERNRVKRIEREDQAKIATEAARTASLPKLDTSHMLQIKLTDEEIGASKKLGGTFGSRYVHMLVIDRDGRQYLCFMTRFNIVTLWRSGFIPANISPWLVEREENFMVDGVKIRVYPHALRGFDHSSMIWKLWSKLHREFDDMKENHFAVFNSYYDLGRPREVPVHRATA